MKSDAETWKKPVAGGLTSDRVFAWKRTLDPELRRLADQVTHEYLERFDYKRHDKLGRTKHAYRLSPDAVEKHLGFLNSQFEAGVRWLSSDDAAAADLVMEHPKYGKFRNPLTIARLLASRVKLTMDRS